MGYNVCGACAYCGKEQPVLNLFCISCNAREWSKKESIVQRSD